MIIQQDNISEILSISNVDAICITTDGNNYPLLEEFLTKHEIPVEDIINKLKLYNREYGLRVFNLGKAHINGQNINLVAFPVKEDYRDKICPQTIFISHRELTDMCSKFKWNNVQLLAPGLPTGEFSLKELLLLLLPVLDRRVKLFDKI